MPLPTLHSSARPNAWNTTRYPVTPRQRISHSNCATARSYRCFRSRWRRKKTPTSSLARTLMSVAKMPEAMEQTAEVVE